MTRLELIKRNVCVVGGYSIYDPGSGYAARGRERVQTNARFPHGMDFYTGGCSPPAQLRGPSDSHSGWNRCYPSIRPILPQACHILTGVVNGPSKANDLADRSRKTKKEDLCPT
jgi:hypothetical protein